VNNPTVYRCEFKSGDLIDDRYHVIKILGDGSFGVVYQVEENGCKMALKLLRLWEVPPEIREPLMDRFEMEFKTGRIHSDYLVQSLDFGLVKGNPYIVMEFCPGGDLTQLLGSGSQQIPTICQHILMGLHALHVNGKVHRDLKPENVLFKGNGLAALTDFGIAGDRNHRMTQRNIFGKPNQIFGTYAYMPPEQLNRIRGGVTVLPTTDIWSFGVLAFQMLTGELPFGRLESHNDLANYQRRGKDGLWDHDKLNYVTDGKIWKRVIGGCLKTDYRERFQSAKEVLGMIPTHQMVTVNHGFKSITTPKHTNGVQLQVMHGKEYGRMYDLTEMVGLRGRVLTAGRQWNNCIFINSEPDDYVSRLHCTFEAPKERGGIWVVRDGQWNKEKNAWQPSTNGTYVNSQPVGQTGYYLKIGDIIRLGNVALKFENY